MPRPPAKATRICSDSALSWWGTGAALDWTNTRETHFWNEKRPFEVKYEIEKLTRILLTRDPGSTEKLAYKASATFPNPYELELRFEAVLPRVPYRVKPPTER